MDLKAAGITDDMANSVMSDERRKANIKGWSEYFESRKPKSAPQGFDFEIPENLFEDSGITMEDRVIYFIVWDWGITAITAKIVIPVILNSLF